ncbi:hypothetical protein CHS0354_021388 [Potamilus streckersoni]|uniref:Uncharacterized protein n=1 Tax=Potamilus streckersoni TaxID=2493646 RepID=A0AAE0VN18_9BIVA|nr:hypothetical protein CHS0354_021388 [Potamilus streckersoni]
MNQEADAGLARLGERMTGFEQDIDQIRRISEPLFRGRTFLCKSCLNTRWKTFFILYKTQQQVSSMIEVNSRKIQLYRSLGDRHMVHIRRYITETTNALDVIHQELENIRRLLGLYDEGSSCNCSRNLILMQLIGLPIMCGLILWNNSMHKRG